MGVCEMLGVDKSIQYWQITIWLLMGIGFIFPIAPFIAVTIAYQMQRHHNAISLSENLGYAIQTFWISFVFYLAAGMILSGALYFYFSNFLKISSSSLWNFTSTPFFAISIVGVAIVVFTSVWVLFRVTKGILKVESV